MAEMVPDVGIELTTFRLQGDCSTAELIRRHHPTAITPAKFMAGMGAGAGQLGTEYPDATRPHTHYGAACEAAQNIPQPISKSNINWPGKNKGAGVYLKRGVGV
jgi:hypothetical protein